MIKVLSLLRRTLTKRMVHAAAILRNPYCVGVRVLVLETMEKGRAGARDSVLLVRHSYLPGWYLPGGGVDKGETMQEAARRELEEETGILAEGPLALLGVYLNRQGLGRDHVGLFLLRNWSAGPKYLQPNREIADAAFFPLDSLPEDISPATARRLQDWIRAGEAMTASGTGHW